MHINHLRDNTCEAPYQWFVCNTNGFRGCCSDVNVCNRDVPTCPIASRPVDERPSLTTAPASEPSSTLGAVSPIGKAPPASGISSSTSSQSSQHVSGSSASTESRPSPAASLGASGASPVSQGSSNAFNGTAAVKESPHGSSKTPVIAGTVGGMVGAILLIAILASICVCVRKRGKAKEEEKRVLGYYVAPGMYAGGQEDANEKPPPRGSTASTGRFKAALKRGSFVSSLRSSRFTTHGRSPLSPLSPSIGQKDVAPYSDRPTSDTRPELAGTTPDTTPELSSDASFNGRIELAPDPQRSLINSPKQSDRSPTKSESTKPSSAGYSPSGSGPNLNMAANASSNNAGRVPHVMSWMTYHGDEGPYR